MTDIALLIKTHLPDRHYVRRLLTSIDRFNTMDLPCFVVVPHDQMAAFAEFEGSGVQLLTDEDVADRYLVSGGAHGLSAGYLNQEIVKLAFGETGLAQNYFCVDSDAVFLRPFGPGDFLRAPGEPYSVLVEDKELKVEPRYFREHWQGRENAIRRIMDLVGLDDPVIRTCHGHQIFSSLVLASFARDFLAPRGWTYTDAILEVPYEFSWYNMWLQKSQVIPIHAIEPLVKVFHNEEQHLDFVVRGITSTDIARAYLAMVVNSNYSRALDLADAQGDKFEIAGSYFSYQELLKVLRAKGSRTVQRRLGRKS